MAQRILILEKNKEIANRLRVAFENTQSMAAAAPRIVVVKSMRETLMAIEQDGPFDLVFMPQENAGQRARPIRAIQPGLPILLTSGPAGASLPLENAGQFQGLVHLADLEAELPWVLAALDLMDPETPLTTIKPAQACPAIDNQVLTMACQNLDLGPEVKQVVCSRGGEVLASSNAAGSSWEKAVAARLNQTWDNQSRTAQIQFLLGSEPAEEVLLYTRPVTECLLTLVAEPQATVGQLRRLADMLADRLDKTLAGQGPSIAH